MKNFLLYIPFVFLSYSGFSQTQLLKEYDFEKGDYSILGTFSESDRSSLRDSLGEFYTDNIALLNQFKKDFTFTTQGKKYACGYHYTIYLCKKGKILESFRVNLNCNEISTDKGYFYFDNKILRQFIGKLQKPYSKTYYFDSIKEARIFRLKILKDSNLIMSPEPNWISYEGSFKFEYKCKEGTSVCLDKEDSIFKAIENEISIKYPNEKFDISSVGGSLTSISIKLICNKSLYDKFDLYYRDLELNYYKWDSFELDLITYWKIKKH